MALLTKIKTGLNLLIILLAMINCYAQSKVAITIDDVPNTRLFSKSNFETPLLDLLDSLDIPVAIFINEGLIYKTNSVSHNFELLVNWMNRDYMTLGSHTFSHSRYSAVTYDAFKTDIEKGTYITKELAHKLDKPYSYFRFPYNDLGKDSTEHAQIDSLLVQMNFTSTPFTIESSDWMFNYVYEYYLKNDSIAQAEHIGELYVQKTIEYFDFFDSLATKKYNRTINQIYLCHDNALNAQYLGEIIHQLAKANYQFISLDEAITDKAYHQSYAYYKKWGVSWFYRWMPTQKERVQWMKREPNMSEIESLYNALQK